MISALMTHASMQSVLAFAPANQNIKGKRKARDDGLRQTILPFANTSREQGKAAKQSQERRLMEMALKKLGKFSGFSHQYLPHRAAEIVSTFLGTCVILNPDFYKLVERINVLDERATLFPKSLLLPALLTCFKKRTYPDYKHARTSNIWSCREELIQYVAALELEAILDQALESPIGSRKLATKIPGSTTFIPPATPGPGRNITTPLRTPNGSEVRYAETPMKEAAPEMAESTQCDQESVLPEALVKLEKATKMKGIFETLIIPRWQALVAAKQEGNARVRPSALERFEPGR